MLRVSKLAQAALGFLRAVQSIMSLFSIPCIA
jgi:hypothetical protein